MRGYIEGLASPHPLGFTLPPIFLGDSLAQRLTAGLDEVLAPVFSALDNLESYFNPTVAPMDFVEWLAGWVGIALDETWPEDRQRAMIRQAADLYARRGTVKGLVALLGLYVEGDIEVEETGGAAWSPTPGGPVPGQTVPSLKVRIRVADPSAVNRSRVDAVVASAKPAHVPHEIEVLSR